MGAPKWTDAEDRKHRILAETHTYRQIAEILGRSYWAVRGRALRLGISHVKRGENCYNHKLTKGDVFNINTLIEDGMPVKEIARKMEVHPHTIYKIKMGLSWLQV